VVYTAVTRIIPAVITAITLWICSKKYLGGGISNPLGQSGQLGHDSP